MSPRTPRQQRLTTTIVLIALIALAAIGGAFYFFVGDEPVPNATKTANKYEPQFEKEGELYFLDKETNDTLHKVDIEIADDDYQRQRGMMHRSKMSDSEGMLFLFDREDYQSFWMKNTKISLDIIYVNSAMEIVKIQPRQTPFSENQIPSERPAQYVIELIGGATAAHGIEEGDKMSWR